jgi:hypothetical protein
VHSAADRPLVRRLALVLVLAAAPVVPPPATQEPAFDDAAIARAHEQVRADPLLYGERTIKTLRWREGAQQQTPASRPGWLVWIAGFFAWLGQSARYVVWAAASIVAVWLLRYVFTTVPRARSGDADEPLVVPTHVRDLDIRPASLPPDIGAAARAMWDAGEHRAALALLYRGLLSRLAHVHRVPIADYTTEGDCLALSAAHLPAARQAYASRLVGVWQHAVYGHESVSALAIHDLCDGFAPALDHPAAQPRSAGAAPDAEARP